MNDRQKIAILLPRFSGGGAERVSIVLARSLCAYGYDTELWATRSDSERRTAVESEGIATASTRDNSGKLRHRSRKNMEAVARMVAERNISILVVSVAPLGYMKELRGLVGDRCRIVFHLHGQPFWELIAFSLPRVAPRGIGECASRCLSFLRKDLKEKLFHTYTRRAEKLYRDSYEACDAYVVLCEAYRRDLERRLSIAPDESKVRAIYNPVAGMDRLSLFFGKTKCREVLFVGRLTYDDKRVDRLLRIWKMTDRPDWTLRIVGDGPERKNLENLARGLGLKNVVFEGYAVPDRFYSVASIVAMTSTFEGWPGCLLEALAAGCRPIAFACSEGVKEILGEGRGEAVEPFDENKFGRSLSAMMDVYPDGQSDATSLWLRRFSDGAVAEAWHSLFKTLVCR